MLLSSVAVSLLPTQSSGDGDYKTGGTHVMRDMICRWNLDCGHRLPRSCVSTVCGSLSWDYQHIFCVLCLDFKMETVCMWDKNKTGSNKRWQDLNCGHTVSVDGESWCLASRPLYPIVAGASVSWVSRWKFTASRTDMECGVSARSGKFNVESEKIPG